MKTKILTPFLVLLSAVALLAQVPGERSVYQSITAVSTDVGAYVVYIGSSAAAASVAVDAATGDLAFIEDGAGPADIKCPAGGAAGAVDTSDAACDTVAEVASVINKSAHWRFLPNAMLGTDSTNNTLITLGATSAKYPGVGLLKDTVVALNITTVLQPRLVGGAEKGAQTYLAKGQTRPRPNPFLGLDTRLLYASENVASGGTVGNQIVYCVVPNYSSTGAYSEVVNVLYQEAGAATTVTGAVDEFLNNGGLTCNGGKLMTRISATTNLTAPTVIATGRQGMHRQP